MKLQMSRTRVRMGVAAVCAAATGALLWALPVTTAVASSHREAPLITELPKVDGTDFYLFNSYEKIGRASCRERVYSSV